ncbi:hypothetical protein SAMN04487770_12222 [Butyrivibrio sp. ob235]|uniref:hypothetical protein n=1 Tax=Butyrivibrio sp. ob235 TaxID=1761780 RepID=UPI0008AAAB2A|nr:hypothetical protein [Butyrivibrio sp. ob235]SEL96758.1 hypothetical protein SAMN04487770_12222 [Butyrivibrio sp. ob235]
MSTKPKYFVFLGYGGENSIHPLFDYFVSKGASAILVDDHRIPYERDEMVTRLDELSKVYSITLITSSHLWFDSKTYEFSNHHPDPNIIAPLEFLDKFHPDMTVYYPHDMGVFMHESEIPFIDQFDLVLVPYRNNMYYKLRKTCKQVEVVGWIKKRQETSVPTGLGGCKPVFFPSNVPNFYNKLGVEGFAQWFRDNIGPDIPIKMAFGDNGIMPILSQEGYTFLDSSVTVYDAISSHNMVIGSGNSSIIFESAYSGIPTVALLDGIMPDEENLKELKGIPGVYPLHPEELKEFIRAVDAGEQELHAGPNVLIPFEFERVWEMLNN